MTTRASAWRGTGKRCKRDEPIEERTVETYVMQQSQPYDAKVETRCCRACEAEGD
jgi:hypothetical protein